MGEKPCKMEFLGVGYTVRCRAGGGNRLYSCDGEGGTKQIFLDDNSMTNIGRQITHVHVDNDGVLRVLESDIRDLIAGQVGQMHGRSVPSAKLRRRLSTDASRTTTCAERPNDKHGHTAIIVECVLRFGVWHANTLSMETY